MAKGGKKKDAKKQQKIEESDEKKLTEVEKTFYELTITDCKKKLRHLRSHIRELHEDNINIKENLRSLHEDGTDETGELQKTVDDSRALLERMGLQSSELNFLITKNQMKNDNLNKDMQVKYLAMHDQLSSEIKLRNSTINTLDSFRLQSDRLIQRFQEQLDQQNAAKEQFQQALHAIEEDNLKFDAELKDQIDQRLRDIAAKTVTTWDNNSTLRLTRENIAIKKNIEQLRVSDEQMSTDIDKAKRRHHDLAIAMHELEQKISPLATESQAKLKVIKGLTRKCLRLKSAMAKDMTYRNQYMSLQEYRMCERLKREHFKERMRKRRNSLDELQLELNAFNLVQNRLIKNIEMVEQRLQTAKLTVEKAIGVIEQEMPVDVAVATEEELINYRIDHHIFVELFQLFYTDLNLEQLEQDLYSAESISQDIGWKVEVSDLAETSSAALSELFKRPGQLASTSAWSLSSDPLKLPLVIKEPTFTPKERGYPRNTLVDIERGSSFYVSSPRDDALGQLMAAAAAAAEEDEAAGEEEQETASSVSSVDDASPKKETIPTSTGAGDGDENMEKTSGIAADVAKDDDAKTKPTLFDVEYEEEDEGEEKTSQHNAALSERDNKNDEDLLSMFY